MSQNLLKLMFFIYCKTGIIEISICIITGDKLTLAVKSYVLAITLAPTLHYSLETLTRLENNAGYSISKIGLSIKQINTLFCFKRMYMYLCLHVTRNCNSLSKVKVPYVSMSVILNESYNENIHNTCSLLVLIRSEFQCYTITTML